MIPEDDTPLSLSEYLSRPARARLVLACHRALQNRRRDEGLSIRGATSILAGEVGVTDRTIERWISRGIQSCDVNAERILEVAMDLAPRESREILFEDLDVHSRATLDLLLKEYRHGGVASGEETY
jgi:hypothetical protein